MGPRILVWSSLTLAGVVALGVVWRAGAVPYHELGAGDPGVLVRLATGGLRVVVDVAAALNVGSLGFAVGFTAPGGANGLVSTAGYRAVRAASWWALPWCAAALAMVSFTAAADAGVGLWAITSPARWWGLIEAQEEPRTWLVVAILAGVVAVAARMVLTWRAAVGVLLVALVALLPPLAAGHSSSDTDHDVATEAVAVHVVFAAVWVGVLVWLLWRERRLGSMGSAVWARYGRLAAVCWVVVVGSGVVDALVLVADRAGLGSGYGRLVLVKVAAVAVVGVAVVGGRAAMMRCGGRRRWWLGVELVGLGTAMGASAALTQLFPPAFGLPVTIPQTLLGYALPGPPTLAALAGGWRPEVLLGGLGIALGWVYVAAARRLSRSGGRWPRWRVVCWVAGCVVWLVATCSGIGRYEPAMFSMHMLSHLLGGVVAPGLLVQGAPLSLALAAAKPAPAGLPGGAEGVAALMRSWPTRLLCHPLVALGLFAGAPYAVYFTSVFDAAARFHWAHMLLAVFFLVVGYLFAWPTIGVDPVPRPLPHLVRLGMLLAAGPFTAVFAAWVVTTRRVLGNGPAGYNMYRSLHLPWVPDLLADQRLGGAIALGVGEVALFAAVLVLLSRWRRLEEDPSAGGLSPAPAMLAQARSLVQADRR